MAGAGPHERTSRRAFLRTGAALIVGSTAMLPGDGMTTTSPSCAQPNAERQVSLGLEDIVQPFRDWSTVARRLDRANANSISLSAGRTEWSAFPWDSHPDAAPSAVRDSGGDLLADAMSALSPGRRVTLTIDTLIPLLISENRELAGVSAASARSQIFASASALQGSVGDRLVAFAQEVARRYRPDQVALTELLFDGFTFGTDDLLLFCRHSGRDDWPRSADNAIDTAHPAIFAWRCDVIADIVGRVGQAVRPLGPQLAADVRVNPNAPGIGRPDSGHDYTMLMNRADRLVLWNFFDTADSGATDSHALVEDLARSGLDISRLIVQTGLWAKGEGSSTVSPQTLRTSLEGLRRSGVGAVGVTPLSLFTDAHWKAIEEAWG